MKILQGLELLEMDSLINEFKFDLIKFEKIYCIHPFLSNDIHLFIMVKNEKNRLSLSDSLLNVELSAFLLFRSVCVFETVFFVETVHTSVCLCEFLTSSVEWM